MTDFTNMHVPVDTLPQAATVPLTALPEAYLRVLHMSTAIWFGILITAYTVLQLIPGVYMSEMLWGFGVLALLATITTAANRLKFRHRGYALREHDIIFRSGILTVSTTIIPHNRIQHVTIHEGPLMRMHALASLSIFTAGGSTSDLRIAGLPRDTAQVIKEHLTRKSGPVA